MGINGQWIEIFSAGRQTDSKGRVRDWTEEDLDHTVKSYDPANHEAPNVIGHPKDNAPAYGWIEGLKREGKKLLAKLRQVPKEFEEMVGKGLFKKRSVSFYPDGTLRHLGWLGAQPPAVQGLKDVAFKGDEYFTEYEFADEFADRAEGDPPGDKPDPKEPEEEDMGKIEDLEQQLAAEKAAREKAEGERDKAVEDKDKVASDHAESVKRQAAAAREARFDALVKDSKVLPTEKVAVLKFAEVLSGDVTEYEFAEGDGKKSLVDHFFSFIGGRGSHGLFRAMKDPDDTTEEDRQYSEDEKAAALIVGDLGPKKKDE